MMACSCVTIGCRSARLSCAGCRRRPWLADGGWRDGLRPTMRGLGRALRSSSSRSALANKVSARQASAMARACDRTSLRSW